MTHSPNSYRKKRANEYDDMDQMQMTKRARTRNCDHADIADLKDVSCLPQSSNHFPVGAHDKEQYHHASFATNEFHSSFTGSVNHVQSATSYVSQQHSSFHHSNIKYLPDLNAHENPHYYENNKLLFELYVERLRRSTSHSAGTSHQF